MIRHRSIVKQSNRAIGLRWIDPLQ
jgi:hypothetical protein